jgi:hypothetical protein
MSKRQRTTILEKYIVLGLKRERARIGRDGIPVAIVLDSDSTDETPSYTSVIRWRLTITGIMATLSSCPPSRRAFFFSARGCTRKPFARQSIHAARQPSAGE